jgi:hypothetical protein
MRIIAIDASPINGGPASYAVDVAASAAEESGADVVRIRLYDLHAYCCTQCDSCTPTSRCTKRDGLLSHAERVMEAADALVLAAPARLQSRNQGAEALLRRLLGAYTGMSAARGWYNTSSGRTFAEGKRAAIIGSGAPPLGLPIGNLGIARAAGKQLAEAGVTLIEGARVPVRFEEAGSRDDCRVRAEALGRLLAGVSEPPSQPPRRPRRRQRISPLLSPETAR